VKTIVTGATGFLGTALCRRLERDGHSVVRLSSSNCDLRDSRSLDQFASERYDRIYHLAAWTQAGDFCLTHAGEQWVINQQINANVLEWWRRAQPEAKLIAIGTSCAYAEELPLSEANYLRGEPIDGLYTYAMTKRMLYVGLRALHDQFGMRYLCVVPSTLYGPGYHTDGRQLHFIFDLIRKIISGKRRGTPVVLWGDGHQRRELVHVADFVDLMFRLDACCDNDLVNIGAGVDYSIREFAQAICRVVGYDEALIEYDESRYVGARAKRLETAKLRALLGDPAFTSLNEGIAETVQWFGAYADTASAMPTSPA
jgi:GDP-L-fucose synthase